MKTISVGLVVALFSIFSTQAKSAERSGFDIQFGIGSVHAEKRRDGNPWNERNTGVALQYVSHGTLWGKDVDYCVALGQIKNSVFGQTRYLGGCIRKTVLDGSVGKVSVGMLVGVMTYPNKYSSRRDPNDLFPALLPTISTCLKSGLCLDTSYIPKMVGRTDSAALLLMGRFPIKYW